MSCTRHLLHLTWEHHLWRERVTSLEKLVRPATNMWARVVDEEYMRCDKEEFCIACGKVRRQVSCICDWELGEQCELRCASIPDVSRQRAT